MIDTCPVCGGKLDTDKLPLVTPGTSMRDLDQLAHKTACENAPKALKPSVQIEIHQRDWMPGFAGYIEGSLPETGTGHVLLNLGSLLAAVVEDDISADEMPYYVAECLMHEVVHVLEEWAGVEFNEERVAALIEKYREALKEGRNDKG